MLASSHHSTPAHLPAGQVFCALGLVLFLVLVLAPALALVLVGGCGNDKKTAIPSSPDSGSGATGSPATGDAASGAGDSGAATTASKQPTGRTGDPRGSDRDAGSKPGTIPLTVLEELQALGTRSGDRSAADKLHSQALRAHKRGDYAEAEKMWAEAARRDPSWERPFYNLACSTARQGREGDAIAYLRMVADREIDYRRLRKVETDDDLASLQARPELREILDILAEQLLVGSYSPRRADLFDEPSRPDRCKTFTLDPRGRYSFGCSTRYAVDGDWIYAGGILYFHSKHVQKDCRDSDSCPRVAVNDYDALAITQLENDDLCLERVAPDRKWPVERTLGDIVNTPRGNIAPGCYQ